MAAVFDPNDPDAFFKSAMAELDSNQPIIENQDSEFVDAPEHQFDHDTPMDDFVLEPLNILAVNGDGDEAYIPSDLDPEMQIDSQSSDEIGTAPETKGKQPQNLIPYYNPAAEPEETINVSKQSASEKHTTAYLSIFKKASPSSQGEHSAGRSNPRGASTPPTTLPHQPTSASKPDTKIDPKPNLPTWAGPDDLRDLPRAFVRERRWHEKVAHLHPNYALPSHRYWIGILNPGMAPRNAVKEAHFTWMKGNKFTTVETVRRVYATTTMKEGVLIMGGEKPNDDDKMDSLDLFNDKIVLFTIVDEDSPLALGRKITEGLVTQEVVELDD